MKVLVAIIFVIGSVSALGSGPYLPSGWRPNGPSFYLPSEVAKSIDNPLKEPLVSEETEASGSDSLREYGPPKLEEVASVAANQGLPDVATEQTFYSEPKTNEDIGTVSEENSGFEANTEQISAIVTDLSTVTGAQFAEISLQQQTTEALGEVQPTFEARVQDVFAEIAEETSETAGTSETVQQEDMSSATASAQEEAIQTAVAQDDVAVPTAVSSEDIVVPAAIAEDNDASNVAEEQFVVEKVAEEVNNIAEALVNMENEVKAAEVLEGVVETNQDVSGALEQAPEGFLEYGPPGFREYGPPKEEEELARSAAIEEASNSGFENNEVRRRRFSPKFRSARNH